jgi:hypothetical protein
MRPARVGASFRDRFQAGTIRWRCRYLTTAPDMRVNVTRSAVPGRTDKRLARTGPI